ncbi:MAG: hypothetical protein ACM30E_09540, partial [Nitrososphaerales archaeon]
PYRPAPQPVAPGLDSASLPGSSSAVASAAPPVERVDLGASAELTRIVGINTDIAARLREEGIRTLADIANSHPVALATATGVPVGQIVTEDWIGQAQRLM